MYSNFKYETLVLIRRGHPVGVDRCGVAIGKKLTQVKREP